MFCDYVGSLCCLIQWGWKGLLSAIVIATYAHLIIIVTVDAMDSNSCQCGGSIADLFTANTRGNKSYNREKYSHMKESHSDI
jgi:hypothetical protein